MINNIMKLVINYINF